MPEKLAIGMDFCSWVLEENEDCSLGPEKFPRPCSEAVFSAPADYSCKGKLKRVKGYLDPGAHYLLGAASCLPEGILSSQAGIAVASQYGSAKSAWTFYEQMKEKGPRLASPMIFPHGYVNTPANLLAIEHQASGPHMVFSGLQPIRELWEYAVCRLMFGKAPAMLIGAYEAVDRELMPGTAGLRCGACCLVLKLLEDCRNSPAPQFLVADLARLDRLEDSGLGQVENLIRSCRILLQMDT